MLDSIPIPPIPECGTKLSIYERLKCFFHTLSVNPIPQKANDTLLLINETIKAVEDCHSGVIQELNPGLQTKGRMYAIQEDNILREKSGAIVARSKAHKIIIEPTGAFSILTWGDDELLIKRNHETV